MNYRRWAVLAAWWLTAMVQAAPAWEACDEALPARLDPQCARVPVALNPDQPRGEQIALHVMRYAARYQADQREPVFLLAGGPGQGGSDVFPALLRQFDALRAHHPLIIVDQRGTGRSTRPQCEMEESRELVPPSREEILRQTRRCLETVDLDVRYFTTREAVMDLDAVRQALGVEKISLYGGSYGTRLATGYMHAFPQHLQRVILDGVVPVDEPLGVHHAVNLQRVLDRMARQCEQTDACRKQWPELAAHMAALPDRAEQQGGMLRLRHPRSGEWTTLPLSRSLPQITLRMYAYQGSQLALLPWMIEQAWAGDWQPLAAQGLMLSEQLGESIAVIMQNSILCTEDWPFMAAMPVDNRGTVLGDSLMEQIEAICSVWPRGQRIAGVRQPLKTSVPTLLLSGQWDPVTPPAFGERLQQQIPNSRHLVAPGQGHLVILGRCMGRIAGDFIDGTALDALDTGCLERLRPPRLFLSANGPVAAAKEDARDD